MPALQRPRKNQNECLPLFSCADDGQVVRSSNHAQAIPSCQEHVVTTGDRGHFVVAANCCKEGTMLVVIIYKHTKFLESLSRAKYHVPLQSNLHRCNTVKFENNYGAQTSRMSSASVIIGRGTAPSFSSLVDRNRLM